MAKAKQLDPFARSYRLELGPAFSEGARQLWLRMESRGWSQAHVRELLAKVTPAKTAGLISRWLYGDQRPGTEWASRIEQATGIRAALWGQPPLEAFVPPAARPAVAAPTAGAA
jgi:hypothetical protein